MADLPVRLPFADQLEHLRCESIGFDTLARPATKHDAALLRGCDAGSDPFPQQIPLELRERRHQGGDALALRAAQIELQTGLGYERDIPRLLILKGMEQIEHQATPAGELGDENDIDLAGLGERQDLLAFDAVVLRAGAGFLPDSDDFVAGFLGEGLEVSLLAGTGLIGSGYPAMERGGLSQLNPRRQTPRKKGLFPWHSVGLFKVYFKRDGHAAS